METKYELLKVAYDNFGMQGPKSLIKTFKSFPKYIFNDVDDLNDQLLDKHSDHIEIFKTYCQLKLNVFTDLFDFLVKFPEVLRFHKQIFLHRNVPEYNLIFRYSFNEVSTFLRPYFLDYYQLETDNCINQQVLLTLAESWLSRININHPDAVEMLRQSDEILKSILDFKEYLENNCQSKKITQ
ncbi:MAG: hypothetical protein KAT48_08495 [Bacteroidales bacterium]|nr:hypothetical protein [Bacteroidales bacterium]